MKNIAGSCLTKSSSAAGGRSGKIMLITPDRVVYAGLLGRPLAREFGSLTVYVSLCNPFQIQIGSDSWESAQMRVVQPGTQHRITTMDRMIGIIRIEPESVSIDKLPPYFRRASTAARSSAVFERAREGFTSLVDGRVPVDSITKRIDQYFFGETLPVRKLEQRIAAAVNHIKRQPCDSLGAEDLALQVDLSFSRFLHLFKSEVGVSFRRFRAWKRARYFLAYVNSQLNLTDIALETGYPDASHFSHTVRRYWGLTPKDIIAGSRRLAVVMDGCSLISASH